MSVVNKQAEEKFDNHRIINMEKTPVYLDLMPGKMVNEKSAI